MKTLTMFVTGHTDTEALRKAIGEDPVRVIVLQSGVGGYRPFPELTKLVRPFVLLQEQMPVEVAEFDAEAFAAAKAYVERFKNEEVS